VANDATATNYCPAGPQIGYRQCPHCLSAMLDKLDASITGVISLPPIVGLRYRAFLRVPRRLLPAARKLPARMVSTSRLDGRRDRHAASPPR